MRQFFSMLATLLFAAPASAAWLAICPQPMDGRVLAEYQDPLGHKQVLLLNSEPLTGCRQSKLELTVDDIVWAGLVTAEVADLLDRGVSLVADKASKMTAVSEVIPAKPGAATEPAKQPVVPVEADMLRERQTYRPPPTSRSTWIWDVSRVVDQADELLLQMQGAQIETVFVAVRMTGAPLRLAEPGALAKFIAAAGALDIDVWIVEGDPNAVSVEGRPHFLERTAALAAFNTEQPPARRFSGIQYDIEPYLVAGFQLHTNAWLRAYLQTFAELRAQLDVPIEAAVPFWWADLQVDGVPVLAEMSRLVNGLTVMNYRTDPKQLKRLAQPFLRWGVVHQRYVRVAVESVALPDQMLWHFRRGDRGRLWHLDLEGSDVLVLLNRPARNPSGATYHRSYAREVPASGTTFHGQRQLLEAALPDLMLSWSDWESFAGVALHGYFEAGD